MDSLVYFYLTYYNYLSFLLWALALSLFYYFFISTFLEMNMGLLQRNFQDKRNILGAIFASLNTILFIYIIYYFAQIFVAKGASHFGILFLLLAWSFAVIKMNKRFNARPWFSFLLFNIAWLGILLLWIQN